MDLGKFGGILIGYIDGLDVGDKGKIVIKRDV